MLTKHWTEKALSKLSVFKWGLTFYNFLHYIQILFFLLLALLLLRIHPSRRLKGGRQWFVSFTCVRWEAGIPPHYLLWKKNNKIDSILWDDLTFSCLTKPSIFNICWEKGKNKGNDSVAQVVFFICIYYEVMSRRFSLQVILNTSYYCHLKIYFKILISPCWPHIWFCWAILLEFHYLDGNETFYGYNILSPSAFKFS